MTVAVVLAIGLVVAALMIPRLAAETLLHDDGDRVGDGETLSLRLAAVGG
ncbi:hypothetical protein ACFS27_07845 [Promicromonospora vindobonensis]|uniref:Uncharacterized protein n=1 Tax=Promicromonospora vindobonensis TaxID=195748 RepID=A0ABW5VSR0_9MICO